MLQEARFRLVVVHDDEEREYAYTAAAEKLLEAGKQGGWTMVSMKDDWKSVFQGLISKVNAEGQILPERTY